MIQGIDVSHHQGSIDWGLVAKSPVQFAICKASDGVTWNDPFFRRNITGAKAAGLITGAYHFMQPDSDPIDQAKNYLGQLTDADFPILPILDLEPSFKDGVDGWEKYTPQQVWERAEPWLDFVQEKLRKIPILYFDAPFANSKLQMAPFGYYPVYFAKYSAGIPKGWQNVTVFHQYSENGSINGITGPIDLDCTEKSREELLAYTSKGFQV